LILLKTGRQLTFWIEVNDNNGNDPAESEAKGSEPFEHKKELFAWATFVGRRLDR
jgi:hypothetical protein